MAEAKTEELPTIDARATWNKDHEKLGSYKLIGECINCHSEAIGVFTRTYKPSNVPVDDNCPVCGCDTMSWKGPVD